MHIDQIRTFLAVAASGNFNRAAESLNVTQSTVSARIKTLEQRLGQELFLRDRSGAQLTSAGLRFQRHAIRLQQLWRRAESDVALSERHRASIGLGSAVSLSDQLISGWSGWMRQEAPDIALQVVADYSPALTRQLADGVLDIGVMYEPRQMSGLVIEELLAEELLLLTTEPASSVGDAGWRPGYAFIDWGENFLLEHEAAFPDLAAGFSSGLATMALTHILDFGGSAYLPLRMAHRLVREGRLRRVQGAPVFRRTGCVVYSATPADADLLELGLRGVRAAAERIVKSFSDLK